jgi:transposase, IS605 orfB family
MGYTVSIAKEKIEDLNLDISLASSNIQLVKKVAVTDVNDVFCCLLLSNTAKKLYNSSLYLFKQQYKQNQTTLTYETLDKLMKNELLHPNFARLYQDLPAKVSQQVLKLFSQNVKSFFSTKQSKKLTEEERKKVNLPRYYSKNGLVPVYYTSQAISKKAFNKEGVLHFSGTDLKIKLDKSLFQEIKSLSQINQVRIIPSTRNDKNKRLSDLINERDLFTIEIVYTVPKSEKCHNNKSLQLLYRTSIIHKINPKTNKISTIEKKELVEARYTEDFLNSVAGIDQNLDQLAVGVIASDKTLAFNYDIKYLKSVNQYWNKRKAKLQEEISKQEKLLEDLKYTKLDFYQTFLTEYSVSRLIEDTRTLIKKLKNKIKKITKKRNRQIDNYIHQLSRKLINHLSQLGVQNIIYGKNVNFKKEINLGKVTNQNFVNIPFNQIIEKLRYKALLAGINFMTVEESYTSKTSFLDEEKLHSYKHNQPEKGYTFLGNRFARSLFRTQKGYIIHADINASFNIIRKVSGDIIYNFIDNVSIRGSCPKRMKINLS